MPSAWCFAASGENKKYTTHGDLLPGGGSKEWRYWFLLIYSTAVHASWGLRTSPPGTHPHKPRVLLSVAYLNWLVCVCVDFRTVLARV